MAVDSQFRMPGAFSEGVHPGIFRPPPRRTGRSPSNSGYLPSGLLTNDGGTTKRKRVREDGSPRSAVATPGVEDDVDMYTTPRSGRQYILAGQLGNAAVGDAIDTAMGDSMYSDSDYRRRLGSKRHRGDLDANAVVDSVFPASIPQGEGYHSQQRQFGVPPSHVPSASWGSFAVSALGGVVGRIWQFCTAGSFKGFHAGGGKGYEMRPSMETASMFHGDFPEHEYPQHHVPGYFPPPAEDAADPFAGDSRSSSPAAPPAKRRHTAAHDLRKDWVVVDNSGDSPSARTRNLLTPRAAATTTTTASPRNRNSGPSAVTGRRISTPNTRRSQAARPSLASTPTFTASSVPVATASSASYASQRSPSPSKIPTYSPASSMSASKYSASRRQSTAAPAALSHRRTNSGASMASGRASTATRRTQSSFSSDKHGSQHEYVDSSPRLTNEAKKLAARRKREADYADERMDMMGNQMQDMIRQAREALGTKFEVQGDDADGGWEDEEEY